MSNPASDPGFSGVWHDLTSFGSDATAQAGLGVQDNFPTGGKSISFGSTGWMNFEGYNPLSSCSNKPPAATINMWVYNSHKSNHQFIGGSRQGSDGMYFLILNYDVTEARLGTDTDYWDISVDYSSYLNKWTFVSFVAQPTRTDLYLDGVLVGSNTQITGNFNTISNFSIGAEAAAPGNNHANAGNMGYCSVYDRSLSAAEVLVEYNATKAYYGY